MLLERFEKNLKPSPQGHPQLEEAPFTHIIKHAGKSPSWHHMRSPASPLIPPSFLLEHGRPLSIRNDSHRRLPSRPPFSPALDRTSSFRNATIHSTPTGTHQPSEMSLGPPDKEPLIAEQSPRHLSALLQQLPSKRS